MQSMIYSATPLDDALEWVPGDIRFIVNLTGRDSRCLFMNMARRNNN